jgi:hypothetical protein
MQSVIMLNVIMLSVVAPLIFPNCLFRPTPRWRRMSAPVTDASDIPSLKLPIMQKVKAGNTKGGSITVPLTSCLTGLD